MPGLSSCSASIFVPLLAISLAAFACSPSTETRASSPPPATRDAPQASEPRSVASDEAGPENEAATQAEPGLLGAPREYLIDEQLDIRFADGTTREASHRKRKMIVEPREGGLRVRYVAGDRQPAPTDFDASWDLASRELSLELDTQGRLTGIAGREAFHEILLEREPEMFDREQLESAWPINEGMFTRPFRLLFEPFLGVEFPRDGSPHTREQDGVKQVTSAEPLEGDDAGKLRFRHEVEGPAMKVALDRYMFFDLCEGELFEQSALADVTGRWEVELIADPDDMTPSRATVTLELWRTEGKTQQRASSVTTMSFR